MAEFVEVIQKKKEMCNYYDDCDVCPMSIDGIDCESFIYSYPENAEKVIMDWKEPVDWNKVKVDTPILVRDDEDHSWLKRYFAEYKDGKVCAWNSGKTSWSANNEYDIASWKYAKLAEEE